MSCLTTIWATRSVVPEPWFMIYTGNFYESGTLAEANVSAMAGFIANARQWRKYEKRTSKLFKR
jgi:hypothetical protein